MVTQTVLNKPSGPALFDLGEIKQTHDAHFSISLAEMAAALSRHARGDWGELDPEAELQNKRSFENGGILHSSYTTKSGTKFSIITAPTRYETLVTLPQEED
jgi:hypothetical protein